MKTKVIESILRRQSTRYLKVYQDQYGLDIKVTKTLKENAVTDVYGSSSGIQSTGDVYDIKGIITGDAFFATGGDLGFGASAGSFQEGWLYTTYSAIVDSGDIIEILGSDALVRKFRVVQKEGLGETTNVFVKFKLAALGE